jgi:thymidine kinase
MNKGFNGRIKLITGGMFSGKTSALISELERAKFAKKRVILVRPNTDDRKFLTHSGITPQIEEVFLDEVGQLSDKLEYDVIGIDEGQFFTNLTYDVNFLADNGIKVIISALNGTSEREPFDNIQDLIPYVEEIEKKNAVCAECGSEYATYSYYKLGDKKDKIKSGGASDYDALCRKCYNKHFDI